MARILSARIANKKILTATFDLETDKMKFKIVCMCIFCIVSPTDGVNSHASNIN